MRLPLAFALALVLALGGCFGKGDVGPASKSDQQKRADDLLGKEGLDKLIDATGFVPKNYSFAQQTLLPPTNVTFKAVIGPDAVGGYEAENDEGGIDHGTKTTTYDVGSYLPQGQPAEIVLKLYWDASEANSGDIDLVADVPGTKTSYSSTSETLNWNYAVKTMVIDTVGVDGQGAMVGVQVASALVTSGFEYKLDVSFTYVKDVLTPHHPWAVDVPVGANGLLFESEKTGGDEHVTTQFILLDPDDQLVQFVDFNDINIPTQSVFVPTEKPGTYVFYAYFMHGGFLRVKADVPLQNAAARPLALVHKSTADSTAFSPGLAGKDYLNGSALNESTPSDDANAQVVQFSPDGPFPLRVEPYLKGQFTTMAKITLKSPLGIVAQRTAIGRYQDERGTLGYTSDHEESLDNTHAWKNVARGTWQAQIVNDNPSTELGHVVTTYDRGT
ncbi:MAG: hypothetical protein WDA16_02310 [Candidatus Thermoplasmatota archaeon]